MPRVARSVTAAINPVCPQLFTIDAAYAASKVKGSNVKHKKKIKNHYILTFHRLSHSSRHSGNRSMQAAGSGGKDGMRKGPAMTSRSCDCDLITGPALPTLGPEAAECTAHRRHDYKGSLERSWSHSNSDRTAACSAQELRTSEANPFRKRDSEVLVLVESEEEEEMQEVGDSVANTQSTIAEISSPAAANGNVYKHEVLFHSPPDNISSDLLYELPEETKDENLVEGL
ncbi:unnamed protein product [Ranitomeya imitator]|uniref:Uncharacterized protein n=1 Tax=Ranitomeya imitator TaxID=111125 RepID=A0ABN9L8W3_9NEOB|nr:unnamed protein product [Ranitomeya imitator]